MNNMSQNVQLVKSDCSAIDVTTTSKSFTYTWKINNFRLLYKKYKEKRICIDSYKLDSSVVNNETPLWKINLYINGYPNYKYNSFANPSLGVNVVFDTKIINLDYDYYVLHIYIDKKNEKNLQVYRSFETEGVVCFNEIHLKFKDFLLNDNNGLLPDGNLTLKFQLIFTKYELHYNNIYSVNSLSSMNKPKLFEFENMLNCEKFSDAKISVDGKEFHVHKIILSSRSPVFAAMFEHNMRENINNVVKIEDVDHKIMQELLHFIYTGKVNNIEDVDYDLLSAADKYEIEELRLICEESLIKRLKVENVITFLIHAEKYSAKLLKESALQYFNLHKKEIVHTKEFETKLNSFIDLVPDLFKSLV